MGDHKPEALAHRAVRWLYLMETMGFEPMPWRSLIWFEQKVSSITCSTAELCPQIRSGIFTLCDEHNLISAAFGHW